MNYSRYDYKADKGFLDYEFYSEGPKGRIKKVVRFSRTRANGITYFNVGFGDWNEDKKVINDEIVTNNHDRNKILTTVAIVVLEFVKHFPNARLFVQGTTPSRTRLYQMGIAANWDEIEPLLYICGYKDFQWHPFRKSVNYEAFMIFKK